MVEYSTLRLLIWNPRQEGVTIYIIVPIFFLLAILINLEIFFTHNDW